MRDLYLHIGLHKTGTSYLQKLFLENRDLLLAAGLGLGPYLDPLTGSHHPILEAFEREGPARVFARAAECPGERLLISVEELSAEMLDRAAAEAWRDAARAHFAVKVVIFLRRQDHLKESVYAQIVKDWYVGGILGDDHYVYDHDRRVALLEEVFGAGNVTVRLYRDPGPNDLAGELLGALGVTLGRDRLVPVTAQNVSLSRRKVLFLSQVPKTLRAWDDSRYRALPLFVSRVVGQSRAIADDGERFLMSPRQRHALVARHLAGNRAVLARHGIGPGEAGAFLALPDPEAPWTPPAPVTRTEVAAIWRETLAACRPRGALRAARVTALLAPMLLRRGAPDAADPSAADPSAGAPCGT